MKALRSLWRPIVALACTGTLCAGVWSKRLDAASAGTLASVVLGLGGLRTAEKLKGVAALPSPVRADPDLVLTQRSWTMSKLTVLFHSLASTFATALGNAPGRAAPVIRPLPTPVATPGDPAPLPPPAPVLAGDIPAVPGQDADAIARVVGAMEQLRMELETGLSPAGLTFVNQLITQHLPLAGLIAAPVEAVVDPLVAAGETQLFGLVDKATAYAEQQFQGWAVTAEQKLAGIIGDHSTALGGVVSGLEESAATAVEGIVQGLGDKAGGLIESTLQDLSGKVAALPAPAAADPAKK